MTPIREVLERALERLRVLRPKAEVVDLNGYAMARELEERRAERLVERDLLFGPPNDEPRPPRGAA